MVIIGYKEKVLIRIFLFIISLFFLYKYIALEFLENSYSYFVYCTYIILLFSSLLRMKNVRYDEPIFIYIIYQLLYELPKHNIYFDKVGINKFKLVSENYDELEYNLYYNLLNIVLFFFLLLSRKAFENFSFEFKIPKYRKSLLLIYILLFLVSLYGSYVITGFDPTFILKRRLAGNKFEQTKLASNYLFILVSNFTIIFLVFLHYVSFFKKKIYFFILFFVSSSISFFSSGSRSAIILAIILFGLVEIQKIKKFNLNLKTTFLIILLPLLFILLGSIRKTDYTNLSISELVDNISNKEDANSYQYQLRDEFVFFKHSFENSKLGYYYLNIFTSFIPRSFLGGYKPKMADGEIAKEYFKRDDLGLTFNFSTELYLNFFILAPFIAFLFFKFLYIIYLRVLCCGNYFNYFIYLVFISYSMRFYSSFMVYVFQYIIIFYLLNKFFLNVNNRFFRIT